jgi:predicted Zn-dependent peptidase
MKFFRKRLNNGINVLMEKRDVDVVSLSISNPFGGAFETAEEKGVAHFIEHLLFTGTKTRDHEMISREIEKKGGILNAFTDHEVTSYWFKLPSEHVFTGLDILTDMLNNAAFPEEKFEKEKKVILEEIKIYHDDPVKNVFEQIEGNLYEAPFGMTIIGNAKSVSNVSRERVIEIFKNNYNPSNYIVSIVGNADFDKICEYMEKNFKSGEGIPEAKEIKLKNAESVEERAGIDQANFVMAMHAPLPHEREYIVLNLLNAYLADGMSSKLFLEIREKRGLAYHVKGTIRPGKRYSFYTIYAGTRKESIEEVKKIILDEIGKIDSMSEKDLEEMKETLIGYKKVSSEESANVMNELLYHELFGGAEEYYKFEEKVKDVKLDEVKELARKLLKSYSTSAILPK